MSLLIALSVVGRIYLSFIPNVQPTTVIIIISSFILSPIHAIIVAVMSVIVSNMFLGMGYWVVYQSVAWAIISLISSLIGKQHDKLPIFLLAIYSGLCGLLYGAIISVPMAYLMNVNFLTYYIVGLPFDVAHAIGNVIFFLVLYPLFHKVIKVFKMDDAI